MTPLALGYPGWPHPSTSWDWWPFVGMVCALVLLLGTMRLRLGVAVVIATIAAGPLFATAIHRWGVASVLAPIVLVWACVILYRRRPPQEARRGGV